MENCYKEFYYSEDPQDIEKKRNALHSFFPHLMGGKEDSTNYVLLNNGKNSYTPTFYHDAVSKEHIKKSEPKVGKYTKSFNFDPWKREKEIDSLNKSNPNIAKERYSKEDFDYINKSKFYSVIGKSFDFEGGYSNNKHDRGGETNYGITNIFMEQYKHALPDKKVKPIREITKEDAYKLYNAMWNQHNLGHVRDKSIALLLNDYMINSNEWKVAERVQRILNKKGHTIKVDKIIGPRTIEAINNTDKRWLIEEILQDRYNHYRSNVAEDTSQIHNFKGWINRLNKIAELAGSSTRFPTNYWYNENEKNLLIICSLAILVVALTTSCHNKTSKANTQEQYSFASTWNWEEKKENTTDA